MQLLCSYCTAQLRLCFRIGKNPFSHDVAHIVYLKFYNSEILLEICRMTTLWLEVHVHGNLDMYFIAIYWLTIILNQCVVRISSGFLRVHQTHTRLCRLEIYDLDVMNICTVTAQLIFVFAYNMFRITLI